MSMEQWLKSGEYLPPVMRDFHDQKDLFKAISEIINTPEGPAASVSWVAAHCYVIDIFLWFMARRGYTLQKTRKKNIEFRDLIADVAASKERRDNMFISALKQQAGAKSGESNNGNT